MKTFIDFIYSLLIGAAVAVFVGLGIWTFYSEPKLPTYPDYPQVTYDANGSIVQSATYQAQLDKYDNAVKKYDDVQKSYAKKVAGIALAASVVFYVGGLWIMKKNDVVGEGLALGGTFTGIYAAVRAATADSKQLMFASVSLILAMFIVLALYRMRIRRPTKSPVDTPL